MENTRSYLKVGMSLIVNITQVQILAYSGDEAAVPGKATIVGVDKGELSTTRGTSFNIMKSFELRKTGMIDTNDGITSSEKTQLQQISYLILIMRSNFLIDNMVLTSEYGSISDLNAFFLTVYIQHRLIKFLNLDFSISGYILESIDPLNLHLENIDVDYKRNLLGFRMDTV